MDSQCQLTSLDGQRCQHPTFRDTDLCFWHGVWHRAQRQYGHIRGSKARGLQLLLISGVFLTFSLWRVLRTGEIIWLLLSAFVFALAFRFFADSIMGQAYARSTPGVWPKLLAAALALEIIVAMIIAVTLVVFPDTDQPLIDLWTNHHWRVSTEQGSLVLVAGIAISLELTAFKRKILGHPVPYVRGLTWVLIGTALLTIFAPDFVKHPFQSQVMTKQFWEAAIGPHAWSAMSITYLTSFTFINRNRNGILRPRLELHDHRISGQAIAQSYLAYFHLPLLAMLGTRYFMVWKEWSGFFIFFFLSVVLTFVSGILVTLWILRRALWREALAEGQELPVLVKADYEFSSEWSRALKDFGVASRRLRAATYDLIRRADPDRHIDGLTPSQRTDLMVEQTKLALKSRSEILRSENIVARRELLKSMDDSTRHKLYRSLEKLESDVTRAEEEIAKWRGQIRRLEGQENDKLPAGISNLLPIPLTINEKIEIKKALIIQLRDRLGLYTYDESIRRQ